MPPKVPTPSNLHIAALVRVSTDEQAQEGYSPAEQLSRIRDFVQQELGVTIADEDIYQELGVSGRTGDITKRPGLAAILKGCKAGRYSHVIVHKLDRLGRSVSLMSTTLEKFQEYGVTFMSVQDKVDGRTAAGKLFVSIFCAVAQWYSDNLSEEVKKGHEGRRKAGHTNGSLPFGAMKDEATGLAVPDRRPLTLRNGCPATPYDGFLVAMHWLADGKSTRMTAEGLITEGYTVLHNGALFSRGAIRRLRDNRFYLGEIPDGQGGWLPGLHTPLVTTELWNRVQAAGDRNRRNPQTIPTKSHIHPLGGGMLRCAQCWEKGITSTIQGTWKTHTRRAYTCASRNMRGGCTEPFTRAHTIEDQVAWLLEQFALGTANSDRLLELYAASVSHENQSERPDYATQAHNIQGRLDRLKTLYTWGDLSDGEYQEQRRALRIELAQVEVQLEQQPSEQRMLDLGEYLQDASKVWEDAEDEERRDIARLMFERLWIKNQQIIGVEPTPAFAPLFRMLSVSGLWTGGVQSGQCQDIPPECIQVAPPVGRRVPVYGHYPNGAKLASERRAEILQRRGQGQSYQEIMQAMHVGPAMISLVIREDRS